jgi:hypothetical protein
VILLIFGSRELDTAPIGETVLQLTMRNSFRMTDIKKVIHGGARGIDTLAGKWAKSMEIEVEEVKPDYKRYAPKVAPIERNKVMAHMCTHAIGFWDGISKGTMHQVGFLRDLKKPYVLYKQVWTPVESQGFGV